jgi:hypothetical protein
MEEVQSENGGEEVNRPVTNQTSVRHIIRRSDGNSHLYQIPIVKVFLQKMTFTSAFGRARLRAVAGSEVRGCVSLARESDQTASSSTE